MIPLFKSIRKYGFTSPYGPVAFACGLFLLAWVFPPGIYTKYMREPDRMFLDPLTALYFFLCAEAFVLGLLTQRLANVRGWQATTRKLSSYSPVLYFSVPLLAAILFCGIDLELIGAKLNLVALLFARQGQALKEITKSGKDLGVSVWGHAPTVLAGVLWWSMFRIRQFHFSRAIRLLLRFACFVGLILGIVTDVALVDRTRLMPLIGGCMLIFLFNREIDGGFKFGRTAFYGLLFSSTVVALFLALSMLRSSASNLLLGSLFSYSIASYNRLASLLHGQMTYLYGGKGIYLFYYLQEAGNTISKVFDYRSAFGWPVRETLFGSEFSSVALAGLNPKAIWSGVFGYLYADLGWAAPVYVFFAGILAGSAWCQFRRGSAIATVLYPWAAIWVFFWNGWNMFFTLDTGRLIVTGILLTGWERLLLNPLSTDLPLTTPAIASGHIDSVSA